MTAKGKINATNVQLGDRILVQVSPVNGNVTISQTKTGEGVQVVRVMTKTSHLVNGGRRATRVHVIGTNIGAFQAVGIETMWLAPDDNAGIKRAWTEALVEDRSRWAAAELDSIAKEDAKLEAFLDEKRWSHGNIIDMEAEAHRENAQREMDEAVVRELAHDAAKYIDRVTSPVVSEDLTLQSHDGKVTDMANKETTTAYFPGKTEGRTAEDFLASLDETETRAQTGSAVVVLMEKVWTRIRENHPQLPEVVIVTGSGMAGDNKWGHFRANGWTAKAGEEGATLNTKMHELFMAGETLAKGARQVLQTMLHEGAHTLAKVREIQDTSRQGRWHNAKFKTLATEMGLEYRGTTADKALGYSNQVLTADTIDEYRDLLDRLDAEIHLMVSLPGWLGGADEDENGGEQIGTKPRTTEPSTTNLKLTCLCEEPNIIRASKKVAAKAVINCGDCDALFEERS
jgi:hypothetical protein